MKYVWRKQDKNIYLPKTSPQIIELSEMKYVTVSGEGNPNSETFQECIQALYSISYGIKMTLKKETEFLDYEDYTVFPLEGFWNLTEKGINLMESGKEIIDIKDHLAFKIMIRQPNFVNEEYFDKIKQSAIRKNPFPALLDTKFEKITEGLVCQMMHIGSYDDEPATFKKMEEYCTEHGYTRPFKTHKEIYISDFRRVEASKLKTTLRFRVIKQD